MTRRVSLFALYICGLGPKRFLNLQRKFTTAKNMATSLQPGCNNSEEKSENWKPLSVKLGTFNLLAPCYNVVKSRWFAVFFCIHVYIMVIIYRVQNKYLEFQISRLLCCGQYFSQLFPSQEKCSCLLRQACPWDFPVTLLDFLLITKWEELLKRLKL